LSRIRAKVSLLKVRISVVKKVKRNKIARLKENRYGYAIIIRKAQTKNASTFKEM
jgi:hypothetical protein